jgi:hypothetical protein
MVTTICDPLINWGQSYGGGRQRNWKYSASTILFEYSVMYWGLGKIT